MIVSRCNSILRAGLGAVALGAGLLAVAPHAAWALNDPTPIGLPEGQPAIQPGDAPVPAAPSPDQDAPATGGRIGSAPLPPLPAPGAEPQPGSPEVQPAATGGD